jgi:hypothetical protein
MRQALRTLGRAQVGGRVALDRLLPAQVTVERAQARDLALDGRRRHGRPVGPAARQLGHELVEVAALHRERGDALAVEERPNCTRSDRYASSVLRREPALEIEVRQEVEHELVERPRGGMAGSGGHERRIRLAPRASLTLQGGVQPNPFCSISAFRRRSTRLFSIYS